MSSCTSTTGMENVTMRKSKNAINARMLQCDKAKIQQCENVSMRKSENATDGMQIYNNYCMSYFRPHTSHFRFLPPNPKKRNIRRDDKVQLCQPLCPISHHT
jgi:hypothetical protein